MATFVTNGVPKFLKVKGTEKDVFLKTLSTMLFPQYCGSFTKDNTIIVDDIANKHVLNSLENVLLADLWSYGGNVPNDTFLLNVLLPWLQRLHNSMEICLRTF